MTQPTSSEATIAASHRSRIHPDVALSTHIQLLGIIEDWLGEVDPTIHTEAYLKLVRDELVEDIIDLYIDKQ